MKLFTKIYIYIYLDFKARIFKAFLTYITVYDLTHNILKIEGKYNA